MQRKPIFVTVCLAIGINTVLAGGRDDLWEQVEDAERRGLPRTAISILEQIVPGAIADEAYAEAIKAVCFKIVYEGQIQGNLAEEKISRLQAELAEAPEAMVPVLQTVLAHWFWEYFQQNRWRFVGRSQTAEAPGEDFTTWDLPRILDEIDTHFELALDAAEALQQIPIGEYDDLLEKGTVPDSYRPTLYDFLGFEALAFYSTGEQAGTVPQDSFEIMADSPIFAPLAEFLTWAPHTSDTGSAKLKAIQLYQDLLTFHQGDFDKTALIDADLHRLRFGYNQAVGPERDTQYEAALERFVDQWIFHEIAAQALAQWAEMRYDQGDYVQAHELARRGRDLHPESYGAVLCFNLLQRIEARALTIQVERVWNDPWPNIEVTYRNIEQVSFRVVPCDFEAYPYFYVYDFNQKERESLLNSTPVLTWQESLLPTADYQARTVMLPAPKTLSPGCYALFSSHDPTFSANDNNLQMAVFWVSDLALVVRTLRVEGALEGFVLQAQSGRPIAGAVVTRWYRDHIGRGHHPGDHTRTNENGMFSFPSTVSEYNSLLSANYAGQQLVGQDTYRTEKPRRDPLPKQRTLFFTDRSLYRPGQTIHYKGICVHLDQVYDDYHTLENRTVTVVFHDINGQEIERHAHRTNDYGAFSGSVTAPDDRLLGRMSLRVLGEPAGSTYVNVEAYRRPKFRVELDPPAESPRLDTEVAVTGKATAYTGAPIDSALVQWRVERQVLFPRWCWWWPPLPNQAIAHGTTETAANGSFDISFAAKPDLSVPVTDEPIFSYAVYADVTDTTGETRSQRTAVQVGYTALQASLEAQTWQTTDMPVDVTVQTQSVNGDPEPASGIVRVYALEQPEQVVRKEYTGSPVQTPDGDAAYDPAQPRTWPLAEMIAEAPFTTDVAGKVTLPFALEAGIYRALLETQDRFGAPVTARHLITVLEPQAAHFGVKVAHHLRAPAWSAEPGETFFALWGTGYERGRAFVELECRGAVLRAWWSPEERTQEVIEQTVTEEMRGGFTLRVTYVRENRAYISQKIVAVPWTNKKLTVTWERFRSVLVPGQPESWTAIVTGPHAAAAVAEMVAGLYDMSLDQLQPHDWRQAIGGFRSESSRLYSTFENSLTRFRSHADDWNPHYLSVEHSYRHFPTLITAVWLYYDGPWLYVDGGGWGGRSEVEGPAGNAPGPSSGKQASSADFDPGPELDQVPTRANLEETAFFFPHLRSDKDGEVRMEFTLPEALTTWRFLGFAHDNELRSGFLSDATITAKDLMVQPNPPRFVREGDVIEFTVKVTNQSPTRQTGQVRLNLSDARTLAARDEDLGNLTPTRVFAIPSHESRTLSWRLSIPDGCDMLIYKAVGASERLSDGEEGYLPVLSRLILVIESMPLPIRGPQTRGLEFTKLLQSNQSTTLRHQSLTVQMVSQPAWYAVMALPYLMEAPHQCSTRIFNRLYANSLAGHIANSDPKIRRIFDLWKGTETLDSPLEQNQDLKSIILEETPWVRQAIDESQARKQVGILFDENRLADETARALFKLKQMQYDSGLWPWFPGGRGNVCVTLGITTGFGRLRHLGLRDVELGCALKALGALDEWMDDKYNHIMAHNDPSQNHLSPSIALYLYARTFFLSDKDIEPQHQTAFDYWVGQAREYWLSLSRQSQAHAALALRRLGEVTTARAIMASIREHSVYDDELGMYWRDTERSWWWYRAPLETQAMMIEAFDEVEGDAQAVEDCRVWLLKQKQTQDWKTTRATADAIYALLLRGLNWLASDALVEIALAGQWIVPEDIEPGTGFYEERFVRNEIQPEMGQITVRKIDEGVSWGSVHWQYLEDMSKVTPYEGTPLQLQKDIFIKANTPQGQVLMPAPGSLHVGDELVVRITLRVDRDMEYIHMKDQRGSGTEPVHALSGYRYQDGLGYYQSTHDTATHFFMDYLPKGTYVFEYSTRIQHRGAYQTGLATIQCLYAPEFNSHSESFTLAVD